MVGPISVEMRGIVKRFPGVLANDHVDLVVRSGRIVGLLGENGAGKSTLMKMLYGLERPDDGEILVNGEPATFHSPLDAIRAGIGMVHQHFMLIPTMTVSENVALGLPSSRGLRTDLDVVAARLDELSVAYGLRVDPTAPVRHLSVGEQQRVEILKALYRNASVLILDEPTAVLTPQEVEEFFGFLSQIRDRGNAIVFISHKLHEVLAITDEVTVLRDGRNVGTIATAETNKEDLARRMVGREFSLNRERPEQASGPVRLSLCDVHVMSDRGTPAVRGVSLDVHGSEIVGLAGVSGNGQLQLAEAIVGLRRLTAGTVKIDGWDATNRPVRVIVDRGLAYVPEERNRDGMIKEFTIAENLIIARSGEPSLHARQAVQLLAHRRARRPPCQTVRRQDARHVDADREPLGRQRSEGDPRPRAVATTDRHCRRPADPRPGHRRLRVHPRPHRRPTPRRHRCAAHLRGPRRTIRPVRQGGGDVRWDAHGHRRPGRGDTRAHRADDGRGNAGARRTARHGIAR